MSAALATRPAQVHIGLPNGTEEPLVHTGATLETYLKDLGVDVPETQTAIVGGVTVGLDTVLEPEAYATMAPRPANG